jgi:hypothetical protein
VSDADGSADTGAVAQRKLSRLEPERPQSLSDADGATVVQFVAGLPDLHRRQRAGPVPIADRVALARSHAKRLSDRHERAERAMPNADPDRIAVELAGRVLDARRRRQRRAVPVADPSGLTRSGAKRLSDRQQRPKHAVPDAGTDTHAGPVAAAVPHQRERSTQPCPTPAH